MSGRAFFCADAKPPPSDETLLEPATTPIGVVHNERRWAASGTTPGALSAQHHFGL
jgi:hypothetical protein